MHMRAQSRADLQAVPSPRDGMKMRQKDVAIGGLCWMGKALVRVKYIVFRSYKGPWLFAVHHPTTGAFIANVSAKELSAHHQ